MAYFYDVPLQIELASLELSNPQLLLLLFLNWTKSYISGEERMLEKATGFRQR